MNEMCAVSHNFNMNLLLRFHYDDISYDIEFAVCLL